MTEGAGAENRSRRKGRIPYRIAVADRSPTVLKTAGLVFSPPIFELQVFSEGEGLLETLDELSPDAVLLNLSLPGISGYEFVQELKSKEDFSLVPLFILRGAFERIDVDKLSELDCEEVIVEPFDSEALAQRVRQCIEAKFDPKSLPEDPDIPQTPETHSALQMEERWTALLHREIRELEDRLGKKLDAEVKKALSRQVPPTEPDGTGDPETM